MPLALFFGVQSVPTGLGGVAIRTVTEARCTPPWVLGAKHPATHAYVAWTHGDGTHYRVEALGGVGPEAGVKVALWPGVWAKPVPGAPVAAHWQFVGLDADARWAVAKALSLVGRAYDPLELVAQALPGPLGAVLANAEFARGLICTHVATEVMGELGAPARALVAGLPNRIPENLAQAMEMVDGRGEGRWLVRV